MTLDTGRLFPETYDLIDRTRSKYRNLDFISYFPDTAMLEEFVNEQGMSSIFRSLDDRKACCRIRSLSAARRSPCRYLASTSRSPNQRPCRRSHPCCRTGK